VSRFWPGCQGKELGWPAAAAQTAEGRKREGEKEVLTKPIASLTGQVGVCQQEDDALQHVLDFILDGKYAHLPAVVDVVLQGHHLGRLLRPLAGLHRHLLQLLTDAEVAEKSRVKNQVACMHTYMYV